MPLEKFEVQNLGKYDRSESSTLPKIAGEVPKLSALVKPKSLTILV